MIVRTSGRDDGEHFDALVLGAGAAGLICAVEAARRGLAVALVDHQARAGRKLALAGGGMGNVTNRLLDVRHYVGADLSPCRAAFRRFGPDGPDCNAHMGPRELEAGCRLVQLFRTA